MTAVRIYNLRDDGDVLLGTVKAHDGRVVVVPTDEGRGRAANRAKLESLLDGMGRGDVDAESFVRGLPARLHNQALVAARVEPDLPAARFSVPE
jgi:hypothetical protein